MKAMVRKFLRDEQGTETVEWAIIIGIIAVGAIAFMATIGQWVYDQFQYLSNGIEAAPDTPGS
ncbi:MAG: Flp family type IVb pilin [Sedimentisphaerales bacterium]|nr:Flp family type IVb pilin [Sedimentisphaerales bacterium]